MGRLTVSPKSQRTWGTQCRIRYLDFPPHPTPNQLCSGICAHSCAVVLPLPQYVLPGWLGTTHSSWSLAVCAAPQTGLRLVTPRGTARLLGACALRGTATQADCLLVQSGQRAPMRSSGLPSTSATQCSLSLSSLPRARHAHGALRLSAPAAPAGQLRKQDVRQLCIVNVVSADKGAVYKGTVYAGGKVEKVRPRNAWSALRSLWFGQEELPAQTQLPQIGPTRSWAEAGREGQRPAAAAAHATARGHSRPRRPARRCLLSAFATSPSSLT
jgi:hypothetical protein